MTASAPPALVGLGRFFVMSAGAVRAIPRGVHLAELLEKGCLKRLPGGGRSTRYQICDPDDSTD